MTALSDAFIREISAFYFQWPLAFLGLLLIPLFWWWYVRYQRLQWQNAVRFSYASVLEHIQHHPAGWKRLFIPVSISLLLFFLIISLARPALVAQIPTRSVDMMLVMDISLSMLADDIPPDRITNAKEAGIRFVNSLPDDVRIGLELFAGDNYVMSPPTSQHAEIAAYLRNLKKEDLKQRTEIGSALKTSLKILAATEAQRLENTSSKQSQSDSPQPLKQDSRQQTQQKPDQVIILLSDGDSHEGYPWDLAAHDAKRQNVVIHTVAVGKEDATTIVYQGMELPVMFSETTLRRIAEISGGEFFRVFKKDDFRKIYDQIRQRTVHYEERTLDIGFIFSGLALLILLASLLITARHIRPFF